MNKKKNKKIQWDKLLKRLSPYSVKKGLRVISEYGLGEFFLTLKERFRKEDIPYETWLMEHLPGEEELDGQRRECFSYMPKISIVVPVYKTPQTYLIQMLDSVLNQTYPNLELCIADGSGDEKQNQKTPETLIQEYTLKDSRIKYVKLKKNLGISENTNQALSLVTGEFVGLLDHDDVLTPNALYEVVKALNTGQDIDVVYTDEDKVSMELTEYFTPHFKPDFNLDLLRSNNYICHFFIVRYEIIKKVGGFRKDFDGSQDYDFILRCTEAARNIYHIPKILYHWRVHKNSVAENPDSKKYAFDAGKRAIEEHLKRIGQKGIVSDTFNLGFYRVTYPISESSQPLVSILIFHKGTSEKLKKCLDSINSRTSYYNYEIVIIENNNKTEELSDNNFKFHKSEKVRLLSYHQNQSSSLYRFGISQVTGDYIVLLDSRANIVTNDWLQILLGNCARPEIGIVGTKLYDQKGKIQSAGGIIGLYGRVASPFIGMPRAYSGYFHKASIQQNLSAVISSCVMIKREALEDVGGFGNYNSMELALAQLCFQLRNKNYLISFDPFVELYYDRGKEESSSKENLRYKEELETFKEEYKEILTKPDPYYNVNLTTSKGNYSLKI